MNEDKINQFRAITGASAADAAQYLEACGGSVEIAADRFFESSPRTSGNDLSAPLVHSGSPLRPQGRSQERTAPTQTGFAAERGRPVDNDFMSRLARCGKSLSRALLVGLLFTVEFIWFLIDKLITSCQSWLSGAPSGSLAPATDLGEVLCSLEEMQSSKSIVVKDSEGIRAALQIAKSSYKPLLIVLLIHSNLKKAVRGSGEQSRPRSASVDSTNTASSDQTASNSNAQGVTSQEAESVSSYLRKLLAPVFAQSFAEKYSGVVYVTSTRSSYGRDLFQKILPQSLLGPTPLDPASLAGALVAVQASTSSELLIVRKLFVKDDMNSTLPSSAASAGPSSSHATPSAEAVDFFKVTLSLQAKLTKEQESIVKSRAIREEQDREYAEALAMASTTSTNARPSLANEGLEKSRNSSQSHRGSDATQKSDSVPVPAPVPAPVRDALDKAALLEKKRKLASKLRSDGIEMTRLPDADLIKIVVKLPDGSSVNLSVYRNSTNALVYDLLETHEVRVDQSKLVGLVRGKFSLNSRYPKLTISDDHKSLNDSGLGTSMVLYLAQDDE